MTEEYRLRTNSNQMFLITIKKGERALKVNLISGGGGEGMLGWSLGSEKAFLKSAKRKIKEYCEGYNLEYSELV